MRYEKYIASEEKCDSKIFPTDDSLTRVRMRTDRFTFLSTYVI